MTSAVSPKSEERSQSLLLWLVAIGFFMETLDSTIVNTALPGMAKSLGESPLYMQSVVIAYSLTIALLIPVGRLAVLRAFPADKFLHAISFVTIPGFGWLLGDISLDA